MRRMIFLLLLVVHRLSAQDIPLDDRLFMGGLRYSQMQAELAASENRIKDTASARWDTLDSRVTARALARLAAHSDPWVEIVEAEKRAAMPPGSHYEMACSKSAFMTLAFFTFGQSSLPGDSVLALQHALANDGIKNVPVPPEALSVRTQMRAFFSARGYRIAETNPAGILDTYLLAPDERNYGIVAMLFPFKVDPACPDIPNGPTLRISLGDGPATAYRRLHIDSIYTLNTREVEKLERELGVSAGPLYSTVWQAVDDAAHGGIDAELAKQAPQLAALRLTNARLACPHISDIIETTRKVHEAGRNTSADAASERLELESRLRSGCAALPAVPSVTPPPAERKPSSPQQFRECVIKNFPEYKRLGDAYLAAQAKKDAATMLKARDALLAMRGQVIERCGPEPGSR